MHAVDPVNFCPHDFQEGPDIVGGPVVIRLDEVGMLGRDHGTPPPPALASGGVDQPASRVRWRLPGRVGEDGAGVLPARLMFARPASRSPGARPTVASTTTSDARMADDLYPYPRSVGVIVRTALGPSTPRSTTRQL